MSGKKVMAITINHENVSKKDIPGVCDDIAKATGLPVLDVLLDGAEELVKVLIPTIRKER